jgi:hypothetical protein
VSAEERKEDLEKESVSSDPPSQEEAPKQNNQVPPPNPFTQQQSPPPPPPSPEDPGEHSSSEMEKLSKLGYGEKVVEFEEGDYAGNKIRIQTINQEQEFEALAAASSHPNATQARSFMLYSLAIAMTHINGKEWKPRKPISSEDSVLEECYVEIIKLHRPILDRLIEEYRSLQDEVVKKAFFRPTQDQQRG